MGCVEPGPEPCLCVSYSLSGYHTPAVPLSDGFSKFVGTGYVGGSFPRQVCFFGRRNSPGGQYIIFAWDEWIVIPLDPDLVFVTKDKTTAKGPHGPTKSHHSR